MAPLHERAHRDISVRVDKVGILGNKAFWLEVVLGAVASVFTMQTPADLHGSRRWWIQIW